MTGCTQRGCVGTIVDGYCDVCGSPAGAPPFVSAVAVASAAAPVRAARTGLTAGGRGSGFRPEPRNCTQGGCVGTIVDGYCDVCGSPAGAPPFVPTAAAASAASPARDARTGLAPGREGSGIRPGPRNCTQRGCVGTIAAGYCDVCGSPAGAPPFVPAGAAAQQSNLPEEETPTQLLPRVQTTAQPLTEALADVAAAVSEEETPTQLLPRVQTTAQPSTEETSDQAAADPRAAGAENGDEEKVDLAASSQELSSQGLRHSLVDMELMIASIRSGPGAADAEKADAVSADSEVVADESVEAVAADSETTETTPTGPDDHDTVQMPPVGAVAADSEVVDGERVGVVAADSEVVGVSDDHDRVRMPLVGAVGADSDVVGGESADVVAADVEVVDGEGVGVVAAGSVEVDGKEVDAVAAVSEKADTTATGTDNRDTVQMPAVGALSGGRHPLSQLPEEQVPGPAPVQKPAEKKRLESLALAAAALATLLIGALVFANRDVGGVTAQSDATVPATATMPVSKPPSPLPDESTESGGKESTIQLEDLKDSAKPFQTVRIQGTYPGRADILLRVQRWEGGKWVDFPLPTKTDQSGQFTAYVEFGQSGRYTLRVHDPASGLTSETFVLVIKG
jgi:hypothetical protein